MTMFIAYFDGSGSPHDTEALVVAGFLAPAGQWIEFERNWNDCLNDFEVSSLHMKHFAPSRGEFTNWKGDEGKRRHFLSRLISIIKTRVWHSFASAVVMKDYRNVDARYCFHEFSRPYALAGGTCITKAERWKKKRDNVRDELLYVFEDGDLDKGNLMRAAKEQFDLTPSFLKKEQSVAFQAADLLAYEHLKINVKLHQSESGRLFEDELRKPLLELSTIPGGRGDHDWGIHMEGNMLDSCIKDGIALRSPIKTEMGEFYIYENWQAGPRKAVIHKGSCGNCNDGRGKAGGYDPAHAKWHAPFDDLDAARRASNALSHIINHLECRCIG